VFNIVTGVASIAGFFLSAFLLYHGSKIKKKLYELMNERELNRNADIIYKSLESLQEKLITCKKNNERIDPVLRKNLIFEVKKIEAYGKSSNKMRSQLEELSRCVNVSGDINNAIDQISAIMVWLENKFGKRGNA